MSELQSQHWKREKLPSCDCLLCEMSRRVEASGDAELERCWNAVFERGAERATLQMHYRFALEEIANRATVERNPDGDDQAAHTMQLIARETLALGRKEQP